MSFLPIAPRGSKYTNTSRKYEMSISKDVNPSYKNLSSKKQCDADKSAII